MSLVSNIAKGFSGELNCIKCQGCVLCQGIIMAQGSSRMQLSVRVLSKMLLLVITGSSNL